MKKRNIVLLLLVMNALNAQVPTISEKTMWYKSMEWWHNFFTGKGNLKDLEQQLNERFAQINKSPEQKMAIPYFHLSQNINATDEVGNTALHYLATYGETPEDALLARRLIKNGADVNAQNDAGLTSLMLASLGNENFVKLFVDLGARINLKSKAKITALGYAEDVLNDLKANTTETNADRLAQLEHIVRYLEDAQVYKAAKERVTAFTLPRELSGSYDLKEDAEAKIDEEEQH